MTLRLWVSISMLADTHTLPVIALTLVSIGYLLTSFILDAETLSWYPGVHHPFNDFVAILSWPI